LLSRSPTYEKNYESVYSKQRISARKPCKYCLCVSKKNVLIDEKLMSFYL